MTEFLNVEGGRIAYDVTGDGPLLVRSPGMGNRRNAYRFLPPQLVAAGYRRPRTSAVTANPASVRLLSPVPTPPATSSP